MLVLYWLITIIVSYFVFRYAFKNMSKSNKKDTPISFVIFVMIVPIINLIMAIIIMMTLIDSMDATKIVNKIFFIKD